MIPEPCKLSTPITEARKQVRNDIATCELIWDLLTPGFHTSVNSDKIYANLIRKGHLLRMDGLPKAFPDGRPLPKTSQGHLRPRKRTEVKGKVRRRI